MGLVIRFGHSYAGGPERTYASLGRMPSKITSIFGILLLSSQSNCLTLHPQPTHSSTDRKAYVIDGHEVKGHYINKQTASRAHADTQQRRNEVPTPTSIRHSANCADTKTYSSSPSQLAVNITKTPFFLLSTQIPFQQPHAVQRI